MNLKMTDDDLSKLLCRSFFLKPQELWFILTNPTDQSWHGAGSVVTFILKLQHLLYAPETSTLLTHFIQMLVNPPASGSVSNVFSGLSGFSTSLNPPDSSVSNCPCFPSHFLSPTPPSLLSLLLSDNCWTCITCISFGEGSDEDV